MWDNAIGRIRPRLHVIGTPEVPLYLYQTGSRWTLFEGGLTAMGPLVKAQLEAIVGDLSQLEHWFITHAHYDHYGLVPYLAPYLSATSLVLSPAATRSLTSTRARTVAARLNAELAEAWQFDTDPTRMDSLFQDHTPGGLPLIPIEHGQQLQLGAGCRVTAIATPGHSRCAMSFLLEREDLLLVSDALGEYVDEHTFLPLLFDSYSDYRASLQLLATLTPAMIGLGHHGRLSGDHARAAANDALNGLEQLATQLGERQQRGDDLSGFAGELSRQYWMHSRRFITHDLHLKSMLRMIDLIIKTEETDHV